MCDEINVAVSGTKHLPRSLWYKRKPKQCYMLVMASSFGTILWSTVTHLVPYYGQQVTTGWHGAITHRTLLPQPLSKWEGLDAAANFVTSSAWSAVILQHILCRFSHSVVCLMQIPGHYWSLPGQLKITISEDKSTWEISPFVSHFSDLHLW